jgi:hypothetical protein
MEGSDELRALRAQVAATSAELERTRTSLEVEQRRREVEEAHSARVLALSAAVGFEEFIVKRKPEAGRR